MKISIKFCRITKKILTLLILLIPSISFAVYDLPNNNSDCPDNCRQVPWSAGSDQWNSGSLPTYEGVTCTGLTEGDGTTDNTSAIETCLSNISANQASIIPAGIYYINGTVNIPSNKALRGAKASTTPYLPSTDATQTTLKFGASGRIAFGRGGVKGYGAVNLKRIYKRKHFINHGLWSWVYRRRLDFIV